MPRQTQANDLNQKERTRREIARQVEVFLREGGRISMLKPRPRQQPSIQGSAWREYEEQPELLNQAAGQRAIW